MPSMHAMKKIGIICACALFAQMASVADSVTPPEYVTAQLYLHRVADDTVCIPSVHIYQTIAWDSDAVESPLDWTFVYDGGLKYTMTAGSALSVSHSASPGDLLPSGKTLSLQYELTPWFPEDRYTYNRVFVFNVKDTYWLKGPSVPGSFLQMTIHPDPTIIDYTQTGVPSPQNFSEVDLTRGFRLDGRVEWSFPTDEADAAVSIVTTSTAVAPFAPIALPCLDCEGKVLGVPSPINGKCPPNTTNAPIWYSTGAIQMAHTDLESQGFGRSWGQTRSIANQMGTAASGNATGKNNVVSQVPYLVPSDSDGGLVIVGSGTSHRWFDPDDIRVCGEAQRV